MKRILFITMLMLAYYSVVAHKTEASSTILIEQSPNQWLLQVNSALTAFDLEIKHNYGADAYTTPEEFKDLVLSHLRKNISLNMNGTNDIQLTNGQIKLGHETNVVFQLEATPKELNSLQISNSAFKDIYRSQSAFLLVKEDYPKRQFILNDDNHYQVSLSLSDQEVVALGQVPKSPHWQYYFLAFVFAVVGILGLWRIFHIVQLERLAFASGQGVKG